MRQQVIFTALLLIATGSLSEARMAGRDLSQLIDFILIRNTTNPEYHDDLQMPLNDTVKLVVDGLLDRLRCVQQGLTHLQCVQCLNPNVILSMIGRDRSSVVTNRLDLEHLSVVLLNHVLNFRSVCKTDRAERCRTYLDCRNQLAPRLLSPPVHSSHSNTKLLEDVEAVLREIKAYYEPIPGQKCFSAENILAEMTKHKTEGSHHLEEMTSFLVAHILNGDCIDVGEAVTDFIEDIFLHYGDRCNRVITQTGFQKLMNDLRTQDRDDHIDHAMSDYSCTTLSPNPSNDKLITMTDIGGITKELLEHNLYRTKPVNKRTTRGTKDDLTHKHKSLASECLSADGLLRKFLVVPTQTITPVQFLQLCPALVQQVASGVCNFGPNETVKIQASRPTNLEIYGYGTLAVFVISLSSLCGIFLFPILAKSCYKYVMMGFIGLSFGTMAGDALLHLIPQALGLHSHEEEGGPDEHEDLSIKSIPSYIWLQLGVLAAIYALFLLEAITNMFSADEPSHGSGHGHSHVPERMPETMFMKNRNGLGDATINGNTSSIHSVEENPMKKEMEPVIKSTKIICGLTTMSLVIVIGDVFHNFSDGLAIGASFAPGLQGGISTSLAVFCHELPHEFGDFVVLLSTGLSFGKALFVNFLSALFSFVGLYIGIQLGEDNTTRMWILSITAGIFLYVALTEMLPELKSTTTENSWQMLLVKNIGVLVGVFIMITIAILEDHFHI